MRGICLCMDRKMKRIVVIFFITLLSACITFPTVTSKSSRRTDSKWVGHSVDELLAETGEPANIYPVDGGGRAFEYLNLNMAVIGVPSSSPTATSEYVMRPDAKFGISDEQIQIIRPSEGQAVAPGVYTGQSVSRRKTIQHNPATAQYCTILFNVSASDIIESWSVEGTNCK